MINDDDDENGLPPSGSRTAVSSRGGSLARVTTALRLGVELLVLGPPDILDERSVAGDLADDDDGIADGSLGAAAPDESDEGCHQSPAEQAEGEAGEVHHGAVYPSDELEGEDEEGEEEADDDDVGRVM